MTNEPQKTKNSMRRYFSKTVEIEAHEKNEMRNVSKREEK